MPGGGWEREISWRTHQGDWTVFYKAVQEDAGSLTLGISCRHMANPKQQGLQALQLPIILSDTHLPIISVSTGMTVYY